MKRLLTWVIGVLVVVAVVVVADRVAVNVVENTVVRNVESDGDATDATLDIHGFPFVTQIASGTLDHVTGTAATATLGGFDVSDVQVDAHGVGTSSPYTVKSGTASGLVALSSLEKTVSDAARVDVTLAAEDDALAMTLDVLGLDLQVGVVPTVVGSDTLSVDVKNVKVGGRTVSVSDLPASIAALVTELKVPLALPEGVSLTGVAVADDALRVDIEGEDVTLDDLMSS